MRLRELMEKDAPLMLEWMKDPEINRFFRFDPEEKNLDSAVEYIKSSRADGGDVHLAVASDDDEYLGTVSLKKIDRENGNAEYAIALRKKAQGGEAAGYATSEILRIAFEELKLKKVYLNVLEENARAIRFYEKSGFVKEGTSPCHVKIRGEFKTVCWFSIVRE